ncbi:MAG: MurR/RpiR family transcriptional regulator [Clostridia bacterium]|nr:MurR/RpiR family transcriptional regulator [Clostridia bacterium]
MIGKVFDRIESLKSLATKTELKMIERIKTIPREEIIYMSITELAARLKVAEATFLRFCRKLEYRGFQDFKLSLSQELGSEDKGVTASPSKRIATSMVDAIMETYKQFNEEDCRRAASYIFHANKVCVFGVGTSSIVPQMMKNRLVRTGLPVESCSDPHMQTIIASNLGEKDVMILVSVSGATKDIINLAEIAKRNGTPLIVLTNYSKSPLAKYADIPFFTCRKEVAYEGGSLASVVAQAYIADMLCAFVFELQGEESGKRSLNAALAVSDKSI